MKEAIAILTGGGPAPGMNTVVGSVAKTFLAKGYRVIGLHYGYSGLFNPNPRYEDLDMFRVDYIFNQGGSYLTMSRFKPTEEARDTSYPSWPRTPVTSIFIVCFSFLLPFPVAGSSGAGRQLYNTG